MKYYITFCHLDIDTLIKVIKKKYITRQNCKKVEIYRNNVLIYDSWPFKLNAKDLIDLNIVIKTNKTKAEIENFDFYSSFSFNISKYKSFITSSENHIFIRDIK